jgi:GT2 family glycosyltransferase
VNGSASAREAATTPARLAHVSGDLAPVGLVAVVYDQAEADIRRFVSQVATFLGADCHLWLVVTHPDRSVEEMSEHVTVVFLGANLGWTGGANVGAGRAIAAGCRTVVFLNTDIEVLSDQLLRRFLEALRERGDVGLVSCGVVSLSERSRLLYRGGSMSAWTWITRHPGIGRTYEPTHQLLITQIPNGCCMAARVELLDQVGGFDIDVFAYFDEADLAYRAAAVGWRSAVVDSPLLAHDHEGRELTRVSAYYFGRNPLLLARKHLRPWRRLVVALAQLAAAPIYLARCDGKAARAAYVRGLRHGVANLLGQPHVGLGHT